MFFILWSILIIFFTKNNKTIELNNTYTVVEKFSFGFLVEEQGEKIFIKTDKSFSQDSLIKIVGIAQRVKNKSDFDIEKYLKAKKVFFEVKKANLEFVSLNQDWRYKFSIFLNQAEPFYRKYVPLFFLGKYSSENENLVKLIDELNVLHLFVISGAHVGIFYKIIERIGKFFKIKPHFYFSFFLLILIAYLFLTYFKIATLRALIFITLSFFNKHFWKNKHSKIDTLVFTALIFLIYNPFIIYNYSLIYAFVILLTIFSVQKINFKSKVKKNFAISFFAHLVAQLISLSFGKKINLLGFVNIVILTPIIMVSYIIVFNLFLFKELLEYYFTVFEKLLILLRQFAIFADLSFIPSGFSISLIGIVFLIIYYIKRKAKKIIPY